MNLPEIFGTTQLVQASTHSGAPLEPITPTTMTEQIKKLRLFFRTSIAAFEIVRSLNPVVDVRLTEMYALHEAALKEIETETPDMDKINDLLLQIESTAQKHTPPKPNVPIGGLFQDVAIDINKFGMMENSPSWQLPT